MPKYATVRQQSQRATNENGTNEQSAVLFRNERDKSLKVSRHKSKEWLIYHDREQRQPICLHSVTQLASTCKRSFGQDVTSIGAMLKHLPSRDLRPTAVPQRLLTRQQTAPMSATDVLRNSIKKVEPNDALSATPSVPLCRAPSSAT
jgi:hypothetical protein